MPQGKPSKLSRAIRAGKKIAEQNSAITWDALRDAIDQRTDGELRAWELDLATNRTCLNWEEIDNAP